MSERGKGTASVGVIPPMGASVTVTLIIANATVFISSFCIMVIELVAGRLIAKYLGSSLHTWTSIIGVVLAGIAIGNAVGGRLADKFARDGRSARRLLALLFLASGVVSVGISWYNNIAGHLAPLESLESFPLRVALHIALVFFPPAAMLGMISPVVAKMALDLGRKTGRTIGSIYAWGVVGSIIGTFMTGYYFVAEFNTTRIVVGVAVALGTMAGLYGVSLLRRA